MVYVTHDQTEAMTMGDKIVLMKDGFVQQIDAPLDIYAKPENKFVAGFIGSPAMNVLDGSIEKGKSLFFVDNNGGVRLPLQYKDKVRLRKYIGQKVFLGIRPENIQMTEVGTSVRARTNVKVVVEVVEPMGNEIYVHFTTHKSGSQYVARVSSTRKPTAGKPLDLVFDMAQVHFFDQVSEKRI
jgi:multiple sugar transport system ATP-binding protein